MPANHRDNLSASRGNAFGFWFFRTLLRGAGLKPAAAMVWFITFFYALADRQARKKTLSYLRRRFPDAGPVGRFFHTWRLFTAQGQALVLARYLASPNPDIAFLEENRQAMAELLSRQDKGVIIVTSHFGCWQAAMAALAGFNRKINLLVQTDNRIDVEKLMAVPNHRALFNQIIASHTPGGGLLECLQALQNREIVCIMGDRAAGTTTVTADFFGTPTRFPISPWTLAARSGCPAIVFLIAFQIATRQLVFHFSDPILPAASPNHKLTPENVKPEAEKYAAELEHMATRFPYQMFRFED